MSLKENIRHFKSRFVILLRCNFGLLNEGHEKRKYARQLHFNMSLKENIRHFKSRFVILLRCNFGLLNEGHDWPNVSLFYPSFRKVIKCNALFGFVDDIFSLKRLSVDDYFSIHGQPNDWLKRVRNSCQISLDICNSDSVQTVFYRKK